MERTWVRIYPDNFGGPMAGKRVLTRKRWDPATGEGETHMRLLTWPERILWYWLKRVPRYER